MPQTIGEFSHAIIWLLIGGLCELLSMLVIIWTCLEYEVSFFTSHPFLTSFSIAGIGFGFSLVCVLYALKPVKKSKKRIAYSKGNIVLNSPLYQLNAQQIDEIKTSSENTEENNNASSS